MIINWKNAIFQDPVSFAVVIVVELHCRANIKNTNNAMIDGYENKRDPSAFLTFFRFSNTVVVVVFEGLFPNNNVIEDTKTSLAAKLLRIAVPTLQSVPIGRNTGSMMCPSWLA